MADKPDEKNRRGVGGSFAGRRFVMPEDTRDPVLPAPSERQPPKQNLLNRGGNGRAGSGSPYMGGGGGGKLFPGTGRDHVQNVTDRRQAIKDAIKKMGRES